MPLVHLYKGSSMSTVTTHTCHHSERISTLSGSLHKHSFRDWSASYWVSANCGKVALRKQWSRIQQQHLHYLRHSMNYSSGNMFHLSGQVVINCKQWVVREVWHARCGIWWVYRGGWFVCCEKTVGEPIANGKMSTCFYYDDMFANIYRRCNIRL